MTWQKEEKTQKAEYWYRGGNREAEVFANCFSMYASNEQASCEFMKTYFPETWECFVNGLKKGVNNDID